MRLPDVMKSPALLKLSMPLSRLCGSLGNNLFTICDKGVDDDTIRL